MKRAIVNIPFIDRVTGELYEANAEIQLTEERVEEIRSVGVNMISVLGDVEKPKTPRTKKTKE